MDTYAVEMKGIEMTFGGVQALTGVDFNLKVGEVRGLVGKNGAGKSTLMKIIRGVHGQTRGTVKFFGQDIARATSVKDRESTVSMIFQDFSLIPEMSVAQNIFLNAEPRRGLLIDDRTCHARAKEFFDSLGLVIDPGEKVKNLNTNDMQLVEIAKAVLRDKKVLLLDEPTAALEAAATEKLFGIIRRLKAQGISMVISTHHLKHIMDVCDSVTVLRDGKIVMSEEIGQVTLNDIINHMLGDQKYAETKRKAKGIAHDQPLLSVKRIVSRKRAKPVSFAVYPGEVLGLAGLKGSGRTEIFNNLFGIDPVTEGCVILRGKTVTIRNPKDAIAHGITLVPENRHTQGLSLMHSVYDNTLLPVIDRLRRHLLVNDREGRRIVTGLVKQMEIRTESIRTRVSNLSGGNQQKVVVGKSLASRPRVMLMDDPTYGVDIHAKTEIMGIIEQFTDAGNAVILVSSELSELLANCDRILIIKGQEVAGEIEDVPRANLSEDGLAAAIQ